MVNSAGSSSPDTPPSSRAESGLAGFSSARRIRRRELLIVFAVAGVLVAFTWDMFIRSFVYRERYRGEIRALYGALAPGMPRDEVSRLLDRAARGHLTIDRESRELWLAEAPYEFGAGNWIVVIEFEGERARAIRVRTEDGLHIHPTDAPPDRVLPNSS